MNIFIADRQKKVRNALKILLSKHPGWNVTGMVKDPDELEKELHNQNPNVLLLDWSLGNTLSNDLLESLQSTHPDLIIVIMSGNPDIRKQAKTAGVDLFINKLDSPHSLISTLNACERKIEQKNTSTQEHLPLK